MNDKDVFFERKLNFVLKDYDTAFSSFNRHESQRMSLRSLNVSLLLGYFGLLAALKLPITLLAIISIFLLSIGFLYLELMQYGWRDFCFKNILEIEKIFIIKEEQKFKEKIQEYKTRNLRIEQPKNSEEPKIRGLIKCFCKTKEIYTWYLLLVVLVILLLCLAKTLHP